jgi:hypothetical protein
MYHMTKPKISCDYISNVYIACLGIIYPPSKYVLSTPSKLSPLAPKVANAVDRGLPNSVIGTLPSIGLTLLLFPACPQALVGAQLHSKPIALSKAHQQRWLEYALEHQHWTLDDWSRVVWSDETKINQMGSDGRS